MSDLDALLPVNYQLCAGRVRMHQNGSGALLPCMFVAEPAHDVCLSHLRVRTLKVPQLRNDTAALPGAVIVVVP